MKSLNTRGRSVLFKPLLKSRSVQAAMMVLKPGESSSDSLENEHPWAEQWLLVLSGSGRAKSRRRGIPIRRGTLVFIPKRQPHQITNTGRRQLVTINFYSPPAYDANGSVKSFVV